MRLCWADRAGIVWGLFVLGVLALMWAAPNQSIADMPADGWREYCYIVGIGWAVFRAIDFLAGGPARRRRTTPEPEFLMPWERNSTGGQ